MTKTSLTAPQAAALRWAASRDFATWTPRRDVIRALAQKGLVDVKFVCLTNYRTKRDHWIISDVTLTDAGRSIFAAI